MEVEGVGITTKCRCYLLRHVSRAGVFQFLHSSKVMQCHIILRKEGEGLVFYSNFSFTLKKRKIHYLLVTSVLPQYDILCMYVSSDVTLS